MPTLPFTLRQLEVFASLAASGNFRASAENLGISQASVSNQLKALEDQLGVRLFARMQGRSPRLTPAGRAFGEDLQSFQLAADKLAAHRRSEPITAAPIRFRLLVGQGMFDGYVRHKLDRFSAEHPLIELEFETQPPSDALGRAVVAGNYDFALINQRVDLEPDGLMLCLARVSGGIYGHCKFAEGRKLPLSPEAAAQLPFILPLAGSKQEREVLKHMRQRGVQPANVVGHSQYYDVMAAMLDRGIAVASLSDAILPAAMRETVIQLLPLQDWHLLFYRKPMQTDPRADAVANFLKHAVLDDPSYPAIAKFTQPDDQSNTR
jgi:DNA-binding transcriptional LysR family regulator